MPVMQVILIYVQPTCKFRELDALGLPGLFAGMAKLWLYDAHLLRQGLNIVRDTASRGIFPIYPAKAFPLLFLSAQISFIRVSRIATEFREVRLTGRFFWCSDLFWRIILSPATADSSFVWIMSSSISSGPVALLFLTGYRKETKTG